MKRILLTSLITLCALSCAKAEPLGPGVSVDKQGNLKIDAPLYVINNNPENPGLKRADASLHRAVSFSLYAGDDVGSPLEITGGIVNGRLSITIQKPKEDQYFRSAASFFSVPKDVFKTGSDTAIGEIFMHAVDSDDDYCWIRLYSNPIVKFLKGIDIGSERDVFDVDGGRHFYYYSHGDVSISSRVEKRSQYNNFTWREDYNIDLKQGWNVIRTEELYDEAVNADVFTMTSDKPSTDAVWVLLSW